VRNIYEDIYFVVGGLLDTLMLWTSLKDIAFEKYEYYIRYS